MPRPERQLEPGMIQHLMWHGNRHEVIFSMQEDFQLFVRLLERFTAYYAIKLHGYCLMTNHIHMIAEPSRDNLPYFMQRIGHIYAATFNHKNDLLGHVFSGRYRPVAVATDEHLMAVSRYVHLNPVTASIVKQPQDYAWSSCQEYLGLRGNSFVCTERVLGDYFKRPSESVSKAVESYCSFLYERVEGDGLPRISKIGGIWIYEDRLESQDASTRNCAPTEPLECCEGLTIGFVREIIEDNWQNTHQLPAGMGHDPNDRRDAALYLARALTGATYPEISREFSVEPSTARIAVNRFRRKLAQRAWLRDQVGSLAQLIKAAILPNR